MAERNGQGRIRWAAIGAAIAVTLGAGGIGVVGATISTGPKPVFVSITPCRLVDTRPAPTTVGTRATPLGPGETVTFAVHGTNGNCMIPNGAVTIAANVTIASPSSDSYLTVFPADASQPNASNLNWTAGQAPVPNAVTVDLSPDGKIKVFNERGTVNVIVDIAGYYEDHNHDDRYLQQGQIVTSHSALNYVNSEVLVSSFEQLITRVNGSGDGTLNMALDAPTAVGATAYQLSSLRYCIWWIQAPGYVSQVRVWNDAGTTASAIAVDSTDRSATGCYTLEVPAAPVGTMTWQLNVTLAGGGEVGLSSVQATWDPVVVTSLTDTAVTGTPGENGD